MNDNARWRIIGALHEEFPDRVVEGSDLAAMADNIIAALTSDGDITVWCDHKWSRQFDEVEKKRLNSEIDIF